jgi:acyl-CoA thioesterase
MEISQMQKNKTTRICVIILADFHKAEPSSLFVYSTPPDRSYPTPEDCMSPQQIGRKMVQDGIILEGCLARHQTLLELMARFFEIRQPSVGVFATNLNGLAGSRPTAQNHLPLTAKTSADWFRCREPLTETSDHYAGLAFMMDAYLSFSPLAHSGLSLDDAGACSSLDFALRIFGRDWDLNTWNFRELKTIAGDDGRTYSEARLWNQSRKLVASMTQQCILRPKQKASL